MDNSINSVAFRADGQRVLSGTNCHPASVRMFDVSTSDLVWDYNVGTHYMCIMGVTFSANTNYIAAIEEFGNIFLFDNTGTTPVIIDTINTATSYAFCTTISPLNDILAAGCSGGRLKIYNIPSGTLSNNIVAHSGWVTAVAYSPNGNKIVTGGSDDKVKIWTKTGTLLFTCSGHTGDITSVKITPDSSYVISASQDKTIKIWDIYTGNLIRTITAHTQSVSGIDISPDGTKIVSASADSSCKIWNISTGDLITTFGVRDSGAINAVAWSPDGNKIVTGNVRSDLSLWKINTSSDIQDNFQFISLNVFPNPAQEYCTVEVPVSVSNVKLKIYDYLGRVQKTYSGVSQPFFNISVTDLDEGIYFVVLQKDNTRAVSKLIVKK